MPILFHNATFCTRWRKIGFSSPNFCQKEISDSSFNSIFEFSMLWTLKKVQISNGCYLHFNWMEIWMWPPPLGRHVSLLKLPIIIHQSSTKITWQDTTDFLDEASLIRSVTSKFGKQYPAIILSSFCIQRRCYLLPFCLWSYGQSKHKIYLVQINKTFNCRMKNLISRFFTTISAVSSIICSFFQQ